MKALLVSIALVVSVSGVVAGYPAECLLGTSESTPAYGVLVLRKATVESELAALLEQVTNEHPSLETKRFELRAISREMNRMRAFETFDASKLSTTFGELLLRKVALTVELNDLLGQLTPQHPDVTRKSLQLAAVEREIKNVLP